MDGEAGAVTFRGARVGTAVAPARLMAEREPIVVVPSAKRVRVMFNGKTVADTLCARLILEVKHLPVYYFPREDVRIDLLERTQHGTHCAYKGDASYWTLKVGNLHADNAVWSYESPSEKLAEIRGLLAFYWDMVDHWFEEDEEIFGHPRDPYHRVDVRPSSRQVRVRIGDQTIAQTRRALFLFETDFPVRYYIPSEDVRQELLVPSAQRTTCPYKGNAAYWSVRLGTGFRENIAWSYPEPLPECPRIRNYVCFDPDKVDRLEVEGETAFSP